MHPLGFCILFSNYSQQKALHMQCLFCRVEIRGTRISVQDAREQRNFSSPASLRAEGILPSPAEERGVGSDSPPRIARVSPPKRDGLQKRTSHKEDYLTHGRGEHPSKLGGSPAGVQRTPLRINKFDPQ